MKLSQLVHLKNSLDKLSAKDVQTEAEHDLGVIMYLIQNQPIQLGDFTNRVIQAHQQVHKEFENFQNVIDQLKQELRNQIEIHEKPWFQESYSLYNGERKGIRTEYVLNRKMLVSDEIKNMYYARLQSYSDWRYPGMIIRPGLEDFTKNLVSYDPLYIVDQSHDLLQPTIQSFTESYQRRLRPYIVNEIADGPYLNKIPDNQFGLIFAYNFFNFRPLDVVRQYLVEIYEKLRPGGILVFTFNDCDNDKAVQLVEQYFCCYTPGVLIKELARTIGYEIIFIHSDGGPSTWIEMRKPGKLTSLRGGQTLAKVMVK